MNSISERDAVLEDLGRLAVLLVESIGTTNDDEKSVIWSYIIPVVSHYEELACAKVERYTLERPDGGDIEYWVVDGGRYIYLDFGVIPVPSDTCLSAVWDSQVNPMDDLCADTCTGKLYLCRMWKPKYGNGNPSLTRWNPVTETFETTLGENVIVSADAVRYEVMNVHNDHIIFARQGPFPRSSDMNIEVMLINVTTERVVRRKLAPDVLEFEHFLLLQDRIWVLDDSWHLRRVYNVFTGESFNLHPFFNDFISLCMENVGGVSSLYVINDTSRMLIIDHTLNRVCPVSRTTSVYKQSVVRTTAGRLQVLGGEVEIGLKPVYAHGDADKSFPFILSHSA